MRDLVTNRVNAAITESVVRIAQLMKIGTAAEFVEDEEMLECVRRIGVDDAQGFAIHRPERWLEGATTPAVSDA